MCTHELSGNGFPLAKSGNEDVASIDLAGVLRRAGFALPAAVGCVTLRLSMWSEEFPPCGKFKPKLEILRRIVPQNGIPKR